MGEPTYELFCGDEITDTLLTQATKLFNEHYGVWGREAHRSGAFARPGHRVRLSPGRHRTQCLPSPVEACSLARAAVGGQVVGHAFACRWTYRNTQTVCWVSQLVVHRDWRRRGIATTLLRRLRQDDGDAAYGIMSSHPAACLAAARAFGNGLESLDLNFIREQAAVMIATSPVEYVRGSKLHGSTFGGLGDDGVVSMADSRFYVDHTEPTGVLKQVRKERIWTLGELPQGHEYVLLIEAI